MISIGLVDVLSGGVWLFLAVRGTGLSCSFSWLFFLFCFSLMRWKSVLTPVYLLLFFLLISLETTREERRTLKHISGTACLFLISSHSSVDLGLDSACCWNDHRSSTTRGR